MWLSGYSTLTSNASLHLFIMPRENESVHNWYIDCHILSVASTPEYGFFTCAAAKVWRINLDAGKGQVIDMSAKCTDNWYDQNELTKLFVASNALESIPDDITNLPALVFLDAHDNIINDVTDRICECMELKTVNLGHNKLSKIPYGMCKFVSMLHSLKVHRV